jgi:hypothetical protein
MMELPHWEHLVFESEQTNPNRVLLQPVIMHLILILRLRAARRTSSCVMTALSLRLR